jgi:diguanylate cyclase (GGDEF)-like protein
MSLQRRLTLIFVLIVILPLAAAGFFVQRLVVGEIERRAVTSLGPALDATVAVYNGRAEVLPDTVGNLLRVPRFASLLASNKSAEVGRFLRSRMGDDSRLDFLIAMDASGRQLASVALPGQFLTGFRPPSNEAILKSSPGIGEGFFRTAAIPVKVVGKGKVGSVVGGIWLDQTILAASSQEEVTLSVVVGDTLIASTGVSGNVEKVKIDPVAPFRIDLGGDGDGEARARSLGGGGMTLVASTPRGPINSLGRRILTSLLPLVLLALLGTTGLAYLLARLITQPLGEVAEGAKAIAEGRFDHHIPERTRDEVGQLAAAFNDMTDRLKLTVTELSTSRDQLQRAVRRVGETLRSTHDMGQMLESILNTAVDSTVADAGVLWRFTPTRDALYATAVNGVELESLGTVSVGEGAVGFAAERAARIMLPDDEIGARPSSREPEFPTLIAVPLFSQDRVIGILAVYRREERPPFEPEDIETTVFLAEQGGVAIENVQLHEEARRLSLTDGLTGVWNRRFFQMQFRQVLATSTRFDRPFSLLMLDIDHFKGVNDTHGHQRGDAILVEFSQRVSRTVREVDTFARYGGEEFICLLSETELAGAVTTAEKIKDVIRSEAFGSLGEPPVNLTVSIGVASYPDHGDTFRALVEAADRALYKAKEGGRDAVVAADRRPSGPGLKLAR